MQYEGKQVLVLGLGESGLAIAHWLARAGARLGNALLYVTGGYGWDFLQ
mgnify:CR=1 FL=1